MVKGSAWLDKFGPRRGMEALWSRLFLCHAHKRNVKMQKMLSGIFPHSLPPATEPWGYDMHEKTGWLRADHIISGRKYLCTYWVLQLGYSFGSFSLIQNVMYVRNDIDVRKTFRYISVFTFLPAIRWISQPVPTLYVNRGIFQAVSHANMPGR